MGTPDMIISGPLKFVIGKILTFKMESFQTRLETTNESFLGRADESIFTMLESITVAILSFSILGFGLMEALALKTFNDNSDAKKYFAGLVVVV
jgi:hypothetical protein